MLNRIKKLFVTFVAALTFGTIAPNSHTSSDRSQTSKSNRLEKSASEINVEADSVQSSRKKRQDEARAPAWNEVAAAVSNEDELQQRLVGFTVQHAKKKGYQKFGPVISEQVGEDYQDQILPKISEVMETISNQYDEETLRNLALSQSPASGFGEKIFHIYDSRNGQDLVRFHVRRDHPPKDGYWFNFHYHLSTDQFQSHHELGKIYWDKDMPPRWQA